MNDRQAWLEKRKLSIGASDAVILLLGPQYGRDEESVLSSKLGPAEAIDSDDIRRGTLYEHIVLAEFARLEAWADSIEQAGTDDPMSLFFQLGHVHASLDGIARKDGGAIVIEVKCPRGKKAADSERLGPTQQWEVQCRYQQAVYHLATGTPTEHIGGLMVIWHAEEARYHKHDLTQNQAQWAEAIEWVRYCDAWYRSHVVLGEPLVEKIPVVPLVAWETLHMCSPDEAMIVQWYARAAEAVKAAEDDKKAASVELENIFAKNQARKMICEGASVTRVVQPGRTSLSIDAARKDNPSIDWARYEKKGAGFVTWRVGK